MPKYLIDEKLKMSAVFILEIIDGKVDKTFSFLKGRFCVMGCSMDIIFGVREASKKYNFAIFVKIYQKL